MKTFKGFPLRRGSLFQVTIKDDYILSGRKYCFLLMTGHSRGELTQFLVFEYHEPSQRTALRQVVLEKRNALMEEAERGQLDDRYIAAGETAAYLYAYTMSESDTSNFVESMTPVFREAQELSRPDLPHL